MIERSARCQRFPPAWIAYLLSAFSFIASLPFPVKAGKRGPGKEGCTGKSSTIQEGRS
jgi:hypothetical protein